MNRERPLAVAMGAAASLLAGLALGSITTGLASELVASESLSILIGFSTLMITTGLISLVAVFRSVRIAGSKRRERLGRSEISNLTYVTQMLLDDLRSRDKVTSKHVRLAVNRICAELANAFDVPRASIWVREEPTANAHDERTLVPYELRLLSSYGIPSQTERVLARLPITDKTSEGVPIGTVVRSILLGVPRVVNARDADSIPLPETGPQWKESLHVPLPLLDRVVGETPKALIVLESSSSGVFDESDDAETIAKSLQDPLLRLTASLQDNESDWERNSNRY